MRNVLITVAEQYWQNADNDHFGTAIGAGLRSAQFGCVRSAHMISFRSTCFGARKMGTGDLGDKGELKARTLCAGVSVAWTVRLSREKVEGNRTSCRSARPLKCDCSASHRHSLRQARQKFSRRSSGGIRYHFAQLKNGAQPTCNFLFNAA